MSFEPQIVGSPTPAMLLGQPRKCQSCLISRGMVRSDICNAFLVTLLTEPLPELSISPEQNARLVPPHARKELYSRGIDLENFVPMSQDDMIAHLE